MRQMHVCPQGHHWDPLDDLRPSEDDRWNCCPVCGQGVDQYSVRDSAEKPPTVTRESQAPRSGAFPSIAGYDVLDEIGRGGMGVIYRARHRATDRVVALKMIAAGTQASESDLIRFRTETETVSRLRHKHIVQVHEVGEQDGTPYFALEYMDGGTLERGLGGARLPARFAAELLEMLADAMQAAHEQGVIHRDLKPANIMLTSAKSTSADTVVHLLGTPKIGDFGLAKRIDDDRGQTKSGAIMGTPSYMAPEQAEGKAKAVGPAADIYSLGAILHECLTGRPPFKGATVLETLEQVRSADPVPPSRLAGDVPRAIETICLKALAKRPDQRYRTAGSLAEDLRRFRGGRRIEARSVGIVTRARKWVRKRKALAGTTAGIAIAVIGISIGLGLMNRGKGQDAIEPQPPESEHVAVDPRVTEYYRAVVVRRGVPEGVGPMDEALARRMPTGFRFSKFNGRVEKVEAVDHRGLPTTDYEFDHPLFPRTGRNENIYVDGQEVETTWEYQYDDRGVLVKETALDATRTVVWTAAWSFPPGRPALSRYVDDRGFVRVTGPSGASCVEHTFDEAGWIVKERYLTEHGKPRPDLAGVFGRRFDRDARGLPLTITCLGPRHGTNDPEMLNTDGYIAQRRRFDVHGLETELTYHTFDGKPVTPRRPTYSLVDGFMGVSTRRDGDGRTTEKRAMIRGELKLGVTRYLGMMGEKMPLPDPLKVTAAHSYTYDDRGRPQKAYQLNHEGKALDGSSGYVAVLNEYDDRGNLSRAIPVDENDRPVPIRPGRLFGSTEEVNSTIGTAYRYDDRGRVIESIKLGTDGKPWRPADPNGVGGRAYVTERLTLDENGRVLTANYLDSEGKPAFASADGTQFSYAPRLRFTYTDRGRLTQVEHLDHADRLVDILDIARSVREYDEGGNVSAQMHFDRNGRLAMRKGTRAESGVTGSSMHRRIPYLRAAKVTYKHDDRGNTTETAYFDVNGQRLNQVESHYEYDGRNANRVVRENYAAIRSSYDQNGNRTETSYIGADGNLASIAGAARITREFDDLGNPTAIAVYDAANTIIANEDGVCRSRFTYNERCQIASQRFFDAADRPVAVPSKYMAVVSEPKQPFGTVRLRAVPIANGYVQTRFTYQGDRLVGSEYLDGNGKPMATRVVVSVTPEKGFKQVGTMPLRKLTSATGGLQPGDVLVKYDGEPVMCARLFVQKKSLEGSDGETRPLEILRDGKAMTIHLPNGPLDALKPNTGPLEAVRWYTINATGSALPGGIRTDRTQGSMFVLLTIPSLAESK